MAADDAVASLPPGFKLDAPATPAPPAGYTLDAPASKAEPAPAKSRGATGEWGEPSWGQVISNAFKKGLTFLPELPFTIGAITEAMPNVQRANAVAADLVKDVPKPQPGDKPPLRVPNIGTSQDAIGAIHRASTDVLGTDYDPAHEPKGTAKKMVGRGVEFLAAGGPFSAASIAKSARPVLAGVTEATSSLGAGTGSVLGEDVGHAAERAGLLPKGTGAGIGNILGAIGGGGATAMFAPRAADIAIKGATASAEKASDAVKGLFDPAYRDSMKAKTSKLSAEKAEILVGAELSKILRNHPEALGEIEAAMALSEKVRGYKPDLASASGIEELGIMKKWVDQKDATSVRNAAEQLKGNQKALDAFRSGKFTDRAPELPTRAGESVQGRTADITSRETAAIATLDKQIADTEGQLRMLAENYARNPTKIELGEALSTMRGQYYEMAMELSRAKYDRAFSLVEGKADVGDTVKSIMQVMRSEGDRFQQKPGVYSWLLNVYKQRKAEQMGIAREAEQAALGLGKAEKSLVQTVQEMGGITSKEGTMFDILGERSAGKGKKGIPPTLFHGKGKGVDDLATQLHARGWPIDVEAADGGVQSLKDLLRQEINEGRKVYSYAGMDKMAEAEMAKRMMADLEADMANGTKIEASARELASLHQRINHDMSRTADDTLRGYLGRLKPMVESDLKQTGEEFFNEWKLANEHYGQKVKDVFKQGTGDMLNPMSRKPGTTSKLVDKIMARGEEGGREFKAVFQDDKEAMEKLTQLVMDKFSAEAVKSGGLKQAAIDTFLGKNYGFLKNFPEIRAEFESARKVSQHYEKYTQAAEQSKKAVSKAATEARNAIESSIVARAAGTSTGAEAVHEAIQYPERMTELVRELSRVKGGAEALGSAIAKAAIDTKDPQAFILANERSLKPAMDALGKDHWNNLKTLASVGTQVERAAAAQPTKMRDLGGSRDPVQKMVGTSSSSIFSMLKGMGSWVSPEYAMFHLGGRYVFRTFANDAERVMSEVIYNPELARKFVALAKASKSEKEIATDAVSKLKDISSREVEKIYNDIKGHYENHGIRVSVSGVQAPQREQEYEGGKDRAQQEHDERIERSRSQRRSLQDSADRTGAFAR